MDKEKAITIESNSSFYTIAIEITIIALIILTPLDFYPYLIRIFNLAKELVFEILVIIGLIFWALKITTKEEIKIASTPLNLPALAFMSICAIPLLWSNSPFVSLLELPRF